MGDTERAVALPISRAWLDFIHRDGARIEWKDVFAAIAADQPGMHTEINCVPVDWRAEALRLRGLIEVVRAAAGSYPRGMAVDALLAATAKEPA